FVRTCSEAAAIVEDAEQRVCAVIAPVRADSADTTTLFRIFSEGIPVLAIIEEAEVEAAEHLRDSGFKCWLWDRDWLEQLCWADIDQGSNAVIAFEQRIRQNLRSKVSRITMEITGLNEAYSALRRLQSVAFETDDELLRLSIADGFSI